MAKNRICAAETEITYRITVSQFKDMSCQS